MSGAPGARAAAGEALLLPAHGLPAALCRVCAEPPEDLQVVLDPHDAPGLAPAGVPCFVTAAQFALNWRVFTQDQLSGLDWSNVFAAGGAVLACATTHAPPPAPGDAAETARLLRRARAAGATPDTALTSLPTFLALHGRDAPGKLATSDVDLWLYGLLPEQAAAKVEHIGSVLRANNAKRGAQLFAARTANTVTFFSAFPFRMVQVITAVFDAPAHALLDFDLDACALAYDGAALLALPRAVNALCTGVSVLRADLEPLSRALARCYRYACRGFGAALPRRLPTLRAGVLEPRAADDVFAAAKLGLLLARGMPLPLQALEAWRGCLHNPGDRGDLYPYADGCDEPPQTWVAGFAAPELGPRRGVYASGPDADSRQDWQSGPPAKVAKTKAQRAAEAAPAAACRLVAAMYTRRTLRGSAAAGAGARTYQDEPQEFTAELLRVCDYGIAEPDAPYGPPLADDDGTAPLEELDLEEPESHGRGGERRRPPVSAAEAAAMFEARREGGSVVVARTAQELRTRVLDAGGAAMFARAVFADRRVAAAAGDGGDAALTLETAMLPGVRFPTAGALRAGGGATFVAEPLSALGASWRVELSTLRKCGGGDALVVALTLLAPPPGEGGDAAGGCLATLLPPAALGAQPGPPLLPLNILLDFGGGVFLDSHVLLARAPGAQPATWTHFVWWTHLEPGGGERVLRITLQAVRLT